MPLAIYTSAAFSVAAGVAVAAEADIEVRRESDAALASIFADEAGTAPLTNPFKADVNGRFLFYAAGLRGGYKVKATFGAEVYEVRNQAIGTAAQRDASQFIGDSLFPAADAPAARAALQIAAEGARNLLSMLHVDTRTTRRDLVRAGFLPAFFNQQWGGAPMPFELMNSSDGALHEFEAMSQYIDAGQGSFNGVGSAAGQEWHSQGFKVGKNMTLAAVWVRINKVGNPTDNLQLRVLADDGTGKPSGSVAITNGTATAQSGKLHATGDGLAGHWLRFAFATPPSLVGGTQYHIGMNRSGVNDGSNGWQWAMVQGGKYPHGQKCRGDATPTWTAQATDDHVFLIEPAAADHVLQSGGTFSDGKLVFFEGAPLNQSGGYCRAIRDIKGFDPREFTLLLRGSAFTKNKTFWEMQYGPDHDRIVLRSNITTGFAQVDVYEKDGTKHTVTATSVDLSSGDHDVALYVRAKNDGADRVDLYVDGVANGTAITAASIEFDPNFKRLGTEWLGGGFAVQPAWTQKVAMGVLPSADAPAWTWTGTGTEASCMSVSSGRLYQNKNGYAGAVSGYYERTAVGLSNANGWGAAWKQRPVSATNASGSTSNSVRVADGAKEAYFELMEYFAEVQATGAWQHVHQAEYKLAENAMLAVGKGADYLFFANGRLIADGTGLLTQVSANNRVAFGDFNAGGTENTDVIWDYLAFYNTAWLPPQFTGGSLSEYALWNGDQKAAVSVLWNSGSEISVKPYAGVRENVVGEEIEQQVYKVGVVNQPTTTTTSPDVLLADMEVFVVGSRIAIEYSMAGKVNTAGQNFHASIYVDGVGKQFERYHMSGSVDEAGSIAERKLVRAHFGLHKAEVRWSTGGGTATSEAQRRSIGVEARA